MLVEISGIPRSGKTTLVAAAFPSGWIIHSEAFEKIPFSREEHDKHNLWYAEYVADVVNKSLNSDERHLIERGPFDRIAFSRALFEHNLVTQETVELHENLLMPLITQIDAILVCDISVEESLARDTPSTSITGDKIFLTILRNKYLELAKKLTNAYVLDSTQITEELTQKAANLANKI